MVLAFIHHFQNDGTKNVFTSGCCYWFARILYERFKSEYDLVKIMYDPVANHWVTQIVNRLYDITGDVTSQYHVIDWDDYSDTIHKARLTKQCIKLEM